MSDSMAESAVAQAAKMKIDTQNSILDGKMDSATKEINSGHNAAKAIQF
ncbi:HrpA family pilus protein [Pantoea stewartii subsp. stewartii DC283]|nr:HrpA family pilus protein [Pantoea stewartii subsp. stewartii DC283]